MVDHGIHVAGSDSKEIERRTKLGEIAKVIPPVGLRHHGDAHAGSLQHTSYQCRAEGGVIYIGIAAEEYDVSPLPPQRLHLLPGGWQPVKPVIFTAFHGTNLHIIANLPLEGDPNQSSSQTEQGDI